MILPVVVFNEMSVPAELSIVVNVTAPPTAIDCVAVLEPRRKEEAKLPLPPGVAIVAQAFPFQ